jgi:hypothetical protein
VRFRFHPDAAERCLLSSVPSDRHIRAESKRVQELCDPSFAPVPTLVFRGPPWQDGKGFARRGVEVVYCFPFDRPRADVASLIAHEVAHLIADPDDNHGPSWRATYLRVLREAYGLELEAWPCYADETSATTIATSLLVMHGY